MSKTANQKTSLRIRTKPVDRVAAVRLVLDKKANVSAVAKKYGVARKTVYEWLGKYEKNRRLGKTNLRAVADEYKSGKDHPKAKYPYLEEKILDLVISHPKLTIRGFARSVAVSPWTIWNFLQKRSLSLVEQRLVYARKNRWSYQPDQKLNFFNLYDLFKWVIAQIRTVKTRLLSGLEFAYSHLLRVGVIGLGGGLAFALVLMIAGQISNQSFTIATLIQPTKVIEEQNQQSEPVIAEDEVLDESQGGQHLALNSENTNSETTKADKTDSSGKSPATSKANLPEIEVKTEVNSFQINQPSSFEIQYKHKNDGIINKISRKANQVLGVATEPILEENVEIAIIDAQGNQVPEELIKIEEHGSDAIEVSFDTRNQAKPGKYQIQITYDNQTITQDFTWGVLAINPNKPVYRPNETAKIDLAVLDEEGMMVCDAAVELEISDKKGMTQSYSTKAGSIIVNEECNSKDFTLKPDYELEHLVGVAGEYQLKLTAETENGSYSVTDQILVQEKIDFEIERKTATRIYPPHAYPVTILVTPAKDFSGIVEEAAPTSFHIDTDQVQPAPKTIEERDGRKIIAWEVNWQAGQTYELTYDYKAPNVSPYFYLLGPLELGGGGVASGGAADDVGSTNNGGPTNPKTTEGRQWQIAADAVGGFGSIWYMNPITADTAWGTVGPTSEYSSVNETVSGPSDRTTAFAMTPEIAGTTETTAVATETSGTNPTYQWLRTFLSPKLAAQTLPSGTTFRLEIGISENNAGANAFAQVHIYQWRQGTGHIATLFDGPGSDLDCGLEPDGVNNVSRNMTCITSATGSNASFQNGDQIAVEVWMRSENSQTASRSTRLHYGGDNFIGRGNNNDVATISNAMSSFAVSQPMVLQTSTNKGSNWFLRSTTASTAYGTTGPTADVSGQTDGVPGSPTNKTIALAMTDEIGPSATSVSGTETVGATTFMWMGTFLTPKLAAQTIPTGTTFRLETGMSESIANANAFLRTNIFRWRESDGSSVNILDTATSTDCGIEPDGDVGFARNQVCIPSNTTSNVTLLDGDQLGVEYWVRFNNSSAQPVSAGIHFEGKEFIERGVANDTYTNNDSLSMLSINRTLDYWSVPTITISGNAYEANSSTKWSGCDSSTARVSLVVNGSLAATTSCDSTTGAYSFTGVTVAADDPVSVFYNTAGSNTEKGVGVTVAVDDASDITIDVHENVVKLDTETGVASISNANLGHCTSSTPAACANVPYSISGSNLTVATGVTLRVTTATTFVPGGNVTTTGSAGHLHLDDNSVLTGATTQSHVFAGDVNIDSGATLTAPTSGSIAVAGSWTNAGTFDDGSGTVTFNATGGGETIVTGGDNFYNLTFNNSGGEWTLLDNLNVAGDLTITAGTFNAGSNTIKLFGTDGTPFTSAGTFNAGNSTVSYESTVSSIIAEVTYYKLQTNPPSGTPTYTIPDDITVTNNLILAGAGSAILDADVNDAEVNVQGSMTVGTGQTYSASNLSAMTINGSLTQNGTFDHNFGAIVFDSPTSQTISGSASVTLNDTTFVGGGSWSLPTNVSFGDFTITSGTVTAPAGNMEVRGSFTNNSTFDANGGTLLMSSSGSSSLSGTLTGGSALHNIVFNNGSGLWSFGGNATLSGNFSITAAGMVVAPGTLTVAGNFSSDSSFEPNEGTVILNGAADSTQQIIGTASFYNLNVTAAASRTLQFSASTTYYIGNNLTLEGAACGAELNLVSSNPDTPYTLTVNASTTVVLSYLTIKDLIASYAMTANNSQSLGGNSNITINAGECASKSSSSTATGYSFQRKTFTDVTNSVDWLFFYDGTKIKYNYTSNDGTSWTEGGSLAYNTNDFSVWNKKIGDTEYVYLAVATDNDIILRRGTLGSSSITWDSASPVVVSFDGTGASDTYAHAYLSLDSSDYIWVLARYFDGTNYVIKVIKSTNVATTTWTSAAFAFNPSTQLTDNQPNTNVFGNIVPLDSQEMYATFVSDTVLEGCKWDNADEAWKNSADGSCAVIEITSSGGEEAEYFANLDDGLISYWKMNEASWSGATGEVIDEKGNYHATALGGATTASAGFGRSGNFDGTNDYVNVGDITQLNGASAFTVSQWVYITDVSAQDRIFHKILNGNNDISIAPYNQGGQKLYFEVGNGANSYAYLNTTGIISDNNWYHIVAVFDGSGSTNAAKAKLYINGVNRTLTFSGTFPSTTANLSGKNASIGMGDTEGAPNYFAGKLDDVRVYNRAVTNEEVIKLYQLVPESVNIDDASDFGSMPGAGRQIVRTKSGVTYAFLNDGGNCEMWRSVNGIDWVQQATGTTVTCDTGDSISAAIDNNQDIHVSYTVGPSVKYRKFSTTTNTWDAGGEENAHTFTHELGANATHTSIAVDSSNVPHIAAMGADLEMGMIPILYYLNRIGGSSWPTKVNLAASSMSAPPVEIIINPNNRPEIAYFSVTYDTLTIFQGNTNNATSFESVIVDSTAVISGSNNFSIASNTITGDTWVGYVDNTDYLTLAKHTGTDWSTGWTQITSNTNVAIDPSMTLVGNDIYVFYENDQDDIAYDVYDSITGTWAGEVVLHTGTFQEVKAKGSFEWNNFAPNVIDYMYSDGTDIYYGQLFLRRPPTNIDDASDFGSMPGTGRQIVRTKSGVTYAFLNDGGNCEMWKSTSGIVWSEVGGGKTCASWFGIDAAIDSSDVIHLLYLTTDASSHYLRWTTFNTTSDTFGGSVETIYNVLFDWDTVSFSQLAIDSSNIPHVIFKSGEGGAQTIWYDNRVGGTFNALNIPVDYVMYGSTSATITVDSDNKPQIVYDKGGSPTRSVVVTRGNQNNASSFSDSYVLDADTNYTSRPSIGIDSSGNTWVTYVDSNSEINIAKFTYGSSWTSGASWTVNDSKSDVGVEPSIVIKGTDIYVFYEDDQDDIVYDRYNGSTWGGETVLEMHGELQSAKPKWSYANNYDSTGTHNGDAEIDYLYSDGTDVFYNRFLFPGVVQEQGVQDIIAAVYNGLSKNISTVVDSSGNVHLAYLNYDSRPAYKKWSNGAWDVSSTTLDFSVGWHPSLSLDSATNDLYYLWSDGSGGINYRQYDSSATSWLTEVAWKNVASAVTNVVSNFSGNSRIFGAWTEGNSSLYSAKWDLILGEPPPPTLSVSNVMLNDDELITLTAGTTQTVSWTATVTDTDGYANISTVTGKAYRSGVSGAEACSADDANCYVDASCSLSSCAGNSCLATCSADFKFFAEPTDPGSPYASQYWVGYVSATDNSSENAVGFTTIGSPDLESMEAMDITPTIGYGAISPGDNSGTDNEIVSIINTGNTTLDVEVSGDNMCSDYPTCAGGVITVGYQEFSTSPFTYSLGTMLTTTPQLVYLNLAKSNSIPALSGTNLYWGIGIPTLTLSGSYEGEQTITAVNSD